MPLTNLVLPLHSRPIFLSTVSLDFPVFLDVVHESGHKSKCKLTRVRCRQARLDALFLLSSHLESPRVLLPLVPGHIWHFIIELRQVLDSQLDRVGQSRSLIRVLLKSALCRFLALLVGGTIEDCIVENADLMDVFLQLLEGLVDCFDLYT